MNINNFSDGESILLIGEGNFSFSVSLQKLVPLVKITSTCQEPTVDQQTECQKFENIEKLKQAGVRVLLGVDGTKLPSHIALRKEKFSKIIFNFPHVGGKMKISLNRKLIREFFENVSPVLMPGGLVLMSLCQGQGGTEADVHSRCWGNSWQVVEMAAHGDFVLTAIDSFPSALFPEYNSVGYRSRNQAFHIDNALVHVFRKAEPFPLSLDAECLQRAMDWQSLQTVQGDIICDYIYVDTYNSNPLRKEGSPINYIYETLRKTILADFGDSVRCLPDAAIPLHVSHPSGRYVCRRDGETFPCNLRASLLDIVDNVTASLDPQRPDETLVFAGAVFNPLGCDFSLPPLLNEMLVLGCEGAVQSCRRHVAQLLARSGDGASAIGECRNVACDLVAYVVPLDRIAQRIFRAADWRQMWSASVRNGALIPASLQPGTFSLDVCFSNDDGAEFQEAEFVQALWAAAGRLVVALSPAFNGFRSPAGWHSRCYTLRYCAFDAAMHKRRAGDAHRCIVAAICAKLRYNLH